jgi:LuxR family transcriptional regulator, maltose regulon positive regulatory protein
MHFGRTQITPPSIPPGLVARPALLEALDRGDDRALTLVCAPPGYGKSLLLAHWVRERADTPTAWVNLEPDDNDPRRLWGAVLTALRACPGVPEDSRLHRLVVSRASVELEFLADLVEALDALPVRIRLVLDDAHSLVTPESLRGLQLMMRSPRPQLRLVLATRRDPGLPVARMRLEEQLCELRAQQLQFSAEESALLLERQGIRLAAGHRAELQKSLHDRAQPGQPVPSDHAASSTPMSRTKSRPCCSASRATSCWTAVASDEVAPCVRTTRTASYADFRTLCE